MIGEAGWFLHSKYNLGTAPDLQCLFLVHPIILGKGIPLFKDKVNLKLMKSEPLKSGAVLLTYQLAKKIKI